ncbi:hypothetical protein G7046_g9414 [Stylonectria norvegica]|nr:hypothetical protein G7046_g9414 [Stylonectria norvegica]
MGKVPGPTTGGEEGAVGLAGNLDPDTFDESHEDGTWLGCLLAVHDDSERSMLPWILVKQWNIHNTRPPASSSHRLPTQQASPRKGRLLRTRMWRRDIIGANRAMMGPGHGGGNGEQEGYFSRLHAVAVAVKEADFPIRTDETLNGGSVAAARPRSPVPSRADLVGDGVVVRRGQPSPSPGQDGCNVEVSGT